MDLKKALERVRELEHGVLKPRDNNRLYEREEGESRIKISKYLQEESNFPSHRVFDREISSTRDYEDDSLATNEFKSQTSRSKTSRNKSQSNLREREYPLRGDSPLNISRLSKEFQSRSRIMNCSKQ